MSSGLSRRDFLQQSALTGAGVALIGASEVLLTAPHAAAAPAPAGVGYGPLVPDPAGRLALPKGFRYTIVTEAGVSRLESGELTPSNHDGAGAFAGRGAGTAVVYNHEIRVPFAAAPLPVPHADGLVYDPAAGGGATIVEADRDGGPLRESVGVAGTAVNCAGGVTPWDTWLTCEETEEKAGGANGYTKDHGYVFEVDPEDPGRNRNPQPVKALGRYPHEALAVDPRTGDIYLTEDASMPNGLLYRWEAPERFRLRKGELGKLGPTAGGLGAARCVDRSGAFVDDLSRATEVGTTYRVTWTPVPDRDAATTSTRRQFADGEVTRARKLEGAWWGPDGEGDRGAFIVCSFARAESPVQHDGLVWFYNPRRRTLTLKLRFGVNPQPDSEGTFDGPDNITVSPFGGLILAEDGDGVNQLIGVTEDGESYALARNQLNDSEFTGPVFSRDKRVLYASIQTPGILFAITGPFRRLD